MNKGSKFLFTIIVTTLLFASGIIPTSAKAQQGLTVTKLESWLKAYEEAWETLDADKAAQLFTKDATYQDDPYKDPHLGQEGVHKYWSTVTADQKDVDFTFEVISVTGNTGIAHWHSEFTQASTGATIIIDGMFNLKFSQDGLCESLKEWWHLKFIPAKDE
jgi:ketosteroid isomerase-like protein